ncbi:PilN domain-containing protein [Paenibacillus sp. GYB003]|uniref:PilN domain-containing protein n=1 Tax=Paenibacillus sp. GYB003 TaxID=2994392 RepID=UPI002F9611FD
MKDMNLIPKKPFLEKAFIPLLSAAIGTSLLAAALVSIFVVRYDGDLERRTAEIERMRLDLQRATAARQVDRRTQDYNAMTAGVAKLKDSRRDWSPVFELVSRYVPQTARIVAMEAKEQNRIALGMEFADLTQIAEYTVHLQKSGLIAAVRVSGIERQEKHAGTPAVSSPPVNPPGSAASYNVAIQITLQPLSNGK